MMVGGGPTKGSSYGTHKNAYSNSTCRSFIHRTRGVRAGRCRTTTKNMRTGTKTLIHYLAPQLILNK